MEPSQISGSVASIDVESESNSNPRSISLKTKPQSLSFTEAINEGGMGPYEVLLFLLVAVINNYGQIAIYGYSYLTNPLQYECLQDGKWGACSNDFICSHPEVEHRPDVHDPSYLDGFYSRMDMICWTNYQISSMVQPYFIGLAGTILMLSVPDKIGRKLSLQLICPFLIIGNVLVVYG